MDITQFRKTDKIDVQQKNTIVSNIRAMIKFSNHDMEDHEVKKFVTSMLYKNTGNNYSGSKDANYKSEIVDGFTYLSVNRDFIPTMFSEFLAENYKNPDVFPLSLYGWRKFSSDRTGNSKSIKITNSVDKIPILGDDDKKMITKAEKDLGKLVNEFKNSYNNFYGQRYPLEIERYLNAELGGVFSPKTLVLKMVNVSAGANSGKRMSFLNDNSEKISELDKEFNKTFQLSG